MADLSGIGKTMNVESGSTSLGCTMTNSQIASDPVCSKMNCSSYGRWWCPVTGW
jgi:hypothetical protein